MRSFAARNSDVRLTWVNPLECVSMLKKIAVERFRSARMRLDHPRYSHAAGKRRPQRLNIAPRGDAMGQAVDVHRLHFAFTITFHYIFPQLTMGLALLLVYLKTKALRTGDEHYSRAARFWARCKPAASSWQGSALFTC